jgi:hypothetical protein
MSNIKTYFISQSNWAAIKATKMPLQAKQLYESLCEIGKPTRGVDVVTYAVKNKGLQTRQDYAVLAAWYFSTKRRPAEITHTEPTLQVPAIENMNEVDAPAIAELA